MGMQRTFLRLEKILSTASGSLLDPNSVAMIDCLMSDTTEGRMGQILLSDWITALWHLLFLSVWFRCIQIGSHVKKNTSWFHD